RSHSHLHLHQLPLAAARGDDRRRSLDRRRRRSALRQDGLADDAGAADAHPPAGSLPCRHRPPRRDGRPRRAAGREPQPDGGSWHAAGADEVDRHAEEGTVGLQMEVRRRRRAGHIRLRHRRRGRAEPPDSQQPAAPAIVERHRPRPRPLHLPRESPPGEDEGDRAAGTGERPCRSGRCAGHGAEAVRAGQRRLREAGQDIDPTRCGRDQDGCLLAGSRRARPAAQSRAGCPIFRRRRFADDTRPPAVAREPVGRIRSHQQAADGVRGLPPLRRLRSRERARVFPCPPGVGTEPQPGVRPAAVGAAAGRVPSEAPEAVRALIPMFETAIYTDVLAEESLDGRRGFNFQSASSGFTAIAQQVAVQHMLHQAGAPGAEQATEDETATSFCYRPVGGQYFFSQGRDLGATASGRGGNQITEIAVTDTAEDFEPYTPAQVYSSLTWDVSKRASRSSDPWVPPLDIAADFETDQLLAWVLDDDGLRGFLPRRLTAFEEKSTGRSQGTLILVGQELPHILRWLSTVSLLSNQQAVRSLSFRAFDASPLRGTTDVVGCRPEVAQGLEASHLLCDLDRLTGGSEQTSFAVD